MRNANSFTTTPRAELERIRPELERIERWLKAHPPPEGTPEAWVKHWDGRFFHFPGWKI